MAEFTSGRGILPLSRILTDAAGEKGEELRELEKFLTQTRGRQNIVEDPPLPARGGPGLSLVGVAVRVVVRVAVGLLVVSVVVAQRQLGDEGEEDAAVEGLHANPELACN